METIIDDVLNPFNNFDDFWWEEDVFSTNDSPKTVEVSKDILSEIQEISDNILRNLRLVDNRTEQEKIDDQFILTHNRTQQELEGDKYLSLESDVEIENIDTKLEEDEESDIEIENIDTTNAWDPKKPTTAKPGAVINLSTDYNKKIKAENKMKNKYLRKRLYKEKNLIKFLQIG